MLALKSDSVKFWSNFMSVSYIYLPTTLLSQDGKLTHDKRLRARFYKKDGTAGYIAFKIWCCVDISHMLFCLELNFVIVLNRSGGIPAEWQFRK